MFCKANLMRMILLYIKVETLQEYTVFLSWQLQLIDHNVLVSTVAWRKILLLNFIAPLKKFGRYLDRMLIYNELLPSLLSGYYLPVVRIRVTSKKLTTSKFVSQVILRSKSSLKIFMKAFLILSSWGPLLYPKQAYQANQAKQANQVELCDLVGLHIPKILGEKYGKHIIGLYHDDGLICFGYTSAPQADRTRKDFLNIFNEDFDFSITCETNMEAVNFLDVTLNLATAT